MAMSNRDAITEAAERLRKAMRSFGPYHEITIQYRIELERLEDEEARRRAAYDRVMRRMMR
jgi:hypothetical protein